MPRLFEIVRQTARDVGRDRVLTYAAALAFYTALSLPPLLVILVWLLGAVSPGAEGHLEAEAAQLVGQDGAHLVGAILDNADQRVALGAGVSGWVSAGALLFAASGVFAQLQKALNRIWGVRAKPGSGVLTWLRKRGLSLGLVGVLAFLAAVSLFASALLASVGFGDGEGALARVVEGVASIGVFGLLFAAVFKWLPDVQMAWRDVIGGALLTAVLFSLSKSLISLYLAQKGLGTAYGAAGSAIVVLAWVYLSGVVVFVGAEITKAWLATGGRMPEPSAIAEWIPGEGPDEAA